MLARVVRSVPLILALLASACASPSVPSSGYTSKYGPSAAPGGLAGLVGNSSVITAEEAELRDIQSRATEIDFPARVGLLFYSYSDPLKQEDQQALAEELGKQMVASGIVKSVSTIPAAVVSSGDSLDSMRKLAARFQVDVLLLISGTNSLDRADQQPTGWFSNDVAYDARASLTGLAIGVYSGTFLTPFTATGTAPGLVIDPSSADYTAKVYALRKQAQTQALTRLKDAVVAGLQSTKVTQEAATPRPATPAPTVSPTPSATASPSALRL